MANASQFANQTARTVPPAEPIKVEFFANDPLLSAVGLGKELRADEQSDEYTATFATTARSDMAKAKPSD